MTFTTDLGNAAGAALVAAGVGVYWRKGMVAPAAGVFSMTLMDAPAEPSNNITLTPYITNDELSFDDDDDEVVAALQVRVRAGTSAVVREGVDAVLDVLHGATGLAHGTARVLLCRRVESGSLGSTELGRWEWADTYELYCHRQ